MIRSAPQRSRRSRYRPGSVPADAGVRARFAWASRIPNVLSLSRLPIAAAMLVAAGRHHPTLAVALLASGILTDLLDGILARRWQVQSDVGSHLDSLADVPFCIAIALATWCLWRDVLFEQRVSVAVILAAYVTSVGAGLLRFRRLAALHTWGARASGVLIAAGLLAALFGGARLLALAALARIAATAEELAILRALPEWRPDVGSLRSLRRTGRRMVRAAATLPSRGDR